MNLVPPMILYLSVARPEQHAVHVWLPIFILWPLLLVLGVLALVLTILVDAVLLAAGQRYHHYTILLVRSLSAMCETRGMVVRIHGDDATVDVTVQ